jgi:signal peptidase II
MKRFAWIYLVLGLFVIVADQASKAWALSGAVIASPVTSFLDLELTFNRGVSWGFLQFQSTWLYVLVSLTVLFVLMMLACYALAGWMNRRWIVGEMLLLAGGLSNWADRFMRPGVVDFIKLHWGAYAWPTFNVADVCIVVGLLIMLVGTLRDK